jgi:hypothetical protein
MDEVLLKKIKWFSFEKKMILNKPGHVKEFDGAVYDSVPTGNEYGYDTVYDYILSFVFSLEEMSQAIQNVCDQNLLKIGGSIHLAYPKKGNKVYSKYIDRDSIFPALDVDEDGFFGKTPLKFNTMVSLNDVFTIVGLKYVKPAKPAKPNSANSANSANSDKPVKAAPSQKADDYIDKIPEIRRRLEKNKNVLAFYDNLAPGYQKDWARYVFCAQTQVTVDKRIEEMIGILKEGYKSKDLYRRRGE